MEQHQCAYGCELQVVDEICYAEIEKCNKVVGSAIHLDERPVYDIDRGVG
jgi:hypothetical protein